MHRYVFRNEGRVTQIIKQILLSAIDIYPFKQSLEVVENLDIRIPSEDKTKSKMRLDLAVVLKEDDIEKHQILQKKKERAQLEDSELVFSKDSQNFGCFQKPPTSTEETQSTEGGQNCLEEHKSSKKASKTSKLSQKWRNRRICLAVSKNKRLIKEIIKKHIQAIRYSCWAESGFMGKGGTKEKRNKHDISHTGECKTEMFGICTDLKQWHFSYYSREKEQSQYLRRD